MADYKNLLVEKKGPAIVLTINREKAMNALNRETIKELVDFVGIHWYDPSFSVLIITGAGKAFVAGADISELKDLDTQGGIDLSSRGNWLFKGIQDFPKPVIAAVNGFALGGGCELALACDIRLASEKAKFGQPEVSLGIIPGYGGTQRLSRLVGRGKAMQMILTGDMITAAEAYRIGLVNEVYPAEELLTKALEMANTIASKGPLAMRMAKECINRGQDMSLSSGLAFEKVNFGATCGSHDGTEGCAAFLEKRKAEFKGK
ncbi:MAG: enoyl-CoA hydratase-related protein [candidate division Zixibacteria bacterium]|nr:enoyl-CoA hydratase-related protein [candidate division Zixibacteria bacterium]